MKLKNLDLKSLYTIKEELKSQKENVSLIEMLIFEKELEYLSEDTSATGGPSGAVSGGVGASGVAYANASISGMGNVVSPQPSMFAGTTVEPGYSASGGKEGSGDISVPYNPGGKKKVFQKLSTNADNRKGVSKRRRGKLLGGLKNIFSMKQDYTDNQGSSKGHGKIMDFDKFSKDEFSKVTRVKQ
jgi:hypothetical protein